MQRPQLAPQLVNLQHLKLFLHKRNSQPRKQLHLQPVAMISQAGLQTHAQSCMQAHGPIEPGCMHGWQNGTGGHLTRS